ncbi:hypothetical protein [Roseivivax isoporae]|uniref:Uncharacterized protein n=1 Tax=Roseivivax isoporae LMG 25204 TaxID=1449351 RepID=X7F3X8_9RHOB|nr:hypothetical protein [Roseivivax isoporae]ETX27495.1 hypothetical protein RISW2_13790 [Roseivivax isoporae LMG 25204]
MTPTLTSALRRGAALLALGVLVGAQPYSVSFDRSGTLSLAPAAAEARNGDDDRGGDDHGGRGGDDRGDDDRGGHDDDDRGSDDRGGRGGDDRGDDDRGGRGKDDRGDDDRRGRGRDDAPGDDRGGRRASLQDGGRIEIENGRFERKDAFGTTIEERPATPADLALLNRAGGAGAPGRPLGGGVVSELEVSATGIEVTYTDGWKEEIEAGRYELKDGFNRTVIERPATQDDRARLFGAVR